MNKRKKNGSKILIIVLILIILSAGAYLAFRIITDNQNNNQDNNSANNNNKEELEVVIEPEKPKINIFSGNDRPIAVMIDNHNQAWPQAGLNKAYIVYEIIAEGGETRLMALFKGQDLDKIGPVRSARHYFIDYVMENDAIYAHFGWSPQAQSDIATYRIDNINGITESTDVYWRVSDKYAPHNAVASTQSLLKSAESKGYRTTSTEKSVLNYTADEVNLKDGEKANIVTIPHSTLQVVKYEYDEENKVYKRYARDREQTDWDSGETVTTKNIIVTFCDNYTLDDGENKGRQDIDNIGTLNGYYITNGKAIKIKCIKKARNQKTIYEDLEGNEIKVNDGNTFINICPTTADVTIE